MRWTVQNERGWGNGTKPNSFSASEDANDRLSFISPSETRSLAVAEEYWSRRVKRTGKDSLWGESEVRGGTAGVSSLISER